MSKETTCFIHCAPCLIIVTMLMLMIMTMAIHCHVVRFIKMLHSKQLDKTKCYLCWRVRVDVDSRGRVGVRLASHYPARRVECIPGKYSSEIEAGKHSENNETLYNCVPVSFIIGGDKVHDQHVVLHWVQPIQSHLSQSNNFITTTIRFKADWASGPTVHFLGADTWALGPNVPRTPHHHNHHHHHHYEPDRLETCDDRPW